MKKLLIAAYLLCLSAFTINAQQIVDLTTGTTAVGLADPIWNCFFASATATPYVSNGNLYDTPTNTLYLAGGTGNPWAQNACGKWISPCTITTPTNFGAVDRNCGQAGDYTYRMYFTTNNSCPITKAVINLSNAGADNSLSAIIVNGYTYPISGIWWGSFTPLTINVTGHVFTGPNTIDVIVNNTGSFTGLFLCGNLSIDYNSAWNVTSNSSALNDRGNDIVTDAAGNVYVAGTFENSTHFQAPCGNVLITGSGPAKSAYISKYDPCGNLLWINYEDGGGFSQATGIALDEVRGYAYIVGEGGGGTAIRFQSAVPLCGAATPAAAFTVSNYYVAKFNMSNGAYVDEYSATALPGAVKPNVFLDVQNRNSAFSSTDIYVTGTYINGASDAIFVQKIVELTGVYSSSYRTIGFAAKGNVQDIGYDDGTHGIYITGDFLNIITFGATSLTTSGLSDAFIWNFNESSGTNIVSGIKKLGISSTNTAVGTSVKADVNGIYFTGYFDNNVSGVFGSSFNLTGGPASLIKRSYVIKINPIFNTVTWANQIYSTVGGNVMTSGITLAGNNSQVVVTGRFDNNINFPTAFAPNGTFATSGFKTFVASYDISGVTPLWCNATQNLATNSIHASKRIAGSTQYTYATGSYINEMLYNYSNPPASGPSLYATPANSSNTYIIRNDVTFSGIFRESEAIPEEQSLPVESMDNDEIHLFPNPSTGEFSLDLSGLDNYTSITVYDLIGRLIQSFNYDGNKLKTIDLTKEQNGIYLVKVLTDKKVITKKLILHK